MDVLPAPPAALWTRVAADLTLGPNERVSHREHRGTRTGVGVARRRYPAAAPTARAGTSPQSRSSA